MVERFAAFSGRRNSNIEIVLDSSLTDEFGKMLRTKPDIQRAILSFRFPGNYTLDNDPLLCQPQKFKAGAGV
jgi:hypothetical protein